MQPEVRACLVILMFYAKCCMCVNLCIILRRKVFFRFSRHLSLKKGKNQSLY